MPVIALHCRALLCLDFLSFVLLCSACVIVHGYVSFVFSLFCNDLLCYVWVCCSDVLLCFESFVLSFVVLSVGVLQCFASA